MREDPERIRFREDRARLEETRPLGRVRRSRRTSQPLVNELIYGPISKVFDKLEETSNSVTGGIHNMIKEVLRRGFTPRPSSGRNS